MILRFDGRVTHANALSFQRDFRQAKIKDFGLTSIGYEDVRWLNITVDNSFGVCRIECIRNLDSQIERCFDVQRFPSYLMLEGLAFQILHGNERLSFVLSNFVDRADVRMIK